MKWLRLVLSLLLVLAAGFALWQTVPERPQAISLSNARATSQQIGGMPTLAVTLTITNSGGPDRLLSVSSPEARQVMLHGLSDPAGAPIPAGSAPGLALDGGHVMLAGLTGDLAGDLEAQSGEGRLIPVTLTFAEAGSVSTKVTLSAPGGAMGMARANHGMSHMGAGPGMDLPADEAPGLSLTAAPEGDGWRIVANTTRFTFAPDAMDGAHQPGQGHGHLYIGGLKIMRMTSPEVVIGALPAGRHEIRVTLNTNNHLAYRADGQPVAATATVDVAD